MRLCIVDNSVVKPCGAIYLTERILEEFKEIVGAENVSI